MNKFIKKLPTKPTFSQKGLKGYQFPLNNKNVEVYFVNVNKGHDTYIISKKITHIYYILEGQGLFDINNKKYKVKPNMLIEVPANIEYTYSGNMELLLIMNPAWFQGNERIVKKNPAVE